MCNIILCAFLLFAATLTNGAEREYSSEGRRLVYDQAEVWYPETIAEGMQDLPRGVVRDGRARRQVPSMPELPQPPQGMPAPPQPPQGLPAPPGLPS